MTPGNGGGPIIRGTLQSRPRPASRLKSLLQRGGEYNSRMRHPRLALEIAALLLIKGAMLFALWSVFFAHRPAIDAESVGTHLTHAP